MGLPLNQLQSGLRQAMQPPPKPKQTVQVVNLGPGPDPGTALSSHTFEVYDRQFREWHMQMVCARRNLARRNLVHQVLLTCQVDEEDRFYLVSRYAIV